MRDTRLLHALLATTAPSGRAHNTAHEHAVGTCRAGVPAFAVTAHMSAVSCTVAAMGPATPTE